MFAKVWFR